MKAGHALEIYMEGLREAQRIINEMIEQRAGVSQWVENFTLLPIV